MQCVCLKNFVIRAVQFLSYWSGLDALFYFLNRNAKRVVCLHNVLPDDLFCVQTTGFDGRESEFRQFIRMLSRRFDFSVDLQDPKTLTLSFDDGVLNQYEVVGRVLSEEGNIPALLFVSGRILDECNPTRMLTVDLIALWLAFLPKGTYELEFNGSHYQIRSSSDGDGKCHCAEIVWRLYREDVDSQGERLVFALDKCYSFERVLEKLPQEYVRLRFTGVTRAQLSELKQKGWLIGWHTQSHYFLKSLSTAQLEKELDAPPFIERHIMAYPYGSPDAVDDKAILAVSRGGYGYAFSFMTAPTVRYGRCFLPRYLVGGDKYSVNFVLSGVKHFLKYRRLLPRPNMNDIGAVD